MSKISALKEALWGIEFLLRKLQEAQTLENEYRAEKFLPPLDIESPQTLTKINLQERSDNDYYIYMRGPTPHFFSPGQLEQNIPAHLLNGSDKKIFKITKKIYANEVLLFATETNGVLTLTLKPPKDATKALMNKNRDMLGRLVTMVQDYVITARQNGYTVTPLTHQEDQNNVLDYAAQTTLANKIKEELVKINARGKYPDQRKRIAITSMPSMLNFH